MLFNCQLSIVSIVNSAFRCPTVGELRWAIGVSYDRLNCLALETSDQFIQAAWDALKAKVERELGIQAGAMAVLHTWNQELGHHPHIHMMVAGNGLSLDGQQWIKCRLTKDGKPFLVDNKELGHDFRDRYLDYLRKAEQSGQLNLGDSCFMADLMDDLSLIDWNVLFKDHPSRAAHRSTCCDT